MTKLYRYLNEQVEISININSMTNFNIGYRVEAIWCRVRAATALYIS